MIDLIETIQEYMIDNNLTLSTAESCTAGKLSSLLTSLNGSSKFFNGGIVCYQNYVKQQLLNVNQSTIEQFDVVSREVAIEMVNGLVNLLRTDCGIAVTGYAGETNNPNIKKGTIFAAFKVKDSVASMKFEMNGSKQENLENVSKLILKNFYDYLIYCKYTF